MDISALLKEPLVLAGGGILLLVIISLLISRAVLKARVAGLEKKIETMQAGGLYNAPAPAYASTAKAAASGDFMSEVERLVRANQLIQAIKLYRENTGLGLKESKDAIDSIKGQMNL